MTMLQYNKLIAAFVSVFATRYVLQWTGVDVSTIGIDSEWQAIWTGLVDIVVASVTGFFVWAVPNVKKTLSDFWADVKEWWAGVKSRWLPWVS